MLLGAPRAARNLIAAYRSEQHIRIRRSRARGSLSAHCRPRAGGPRPPSAARGCSSRSLDVWRRLQGTIWPPRSNTCFPFAITQHPNPAGLAETFVAPCFAPFLDNTTNLAERQRSPAVTNVPRSVIPPSKSAQLPALSPPSTTHRCVAHTSVPTERGLTVLPYHLSQSWPRTTSRWT